MSDALKDLIAAVEAGEPNRNDGTLFRLFGDDWVHAWDVIDRGSLDAAVALKNALLPKWSWAVYGDGSAHLWHGLSSVNVADETPARALLLAVLKAYRETTHDPH